MDEEITALRANPRSYLETRLEGLKKTLAREGKLAVAAGMTETAEWFHRRYLDLAQYAEDHPGLIEEMNKLVAEAKPLASRRVNMDRRTMTWEDLVLIWLFELGKDETLVFGPEDATTKEVKNLTGANSVSEVRKIALDKLQRLADGEKDALKQIQYTYGQKEFYEGLADLNKATSFLGSYSTTVDMEVRREGEKRIGVLRFTVRNETSWESGTRLRRAAVNPTTERPEGPHQGIIPKRKRGSPGINLGGTISETWQWSEEHEVLARPSPAEAGGR